MSSNSVSNHTRDKQIGLPLRGRPVLLITRMITDRIGLHSILLSLLIDGEANCVGRCNFCKLSKCSMSHCTERQELAFDSARFLFTIDFACQVAFDLTSLVQIPGKFEFSQFSILVSLWALMLISSQFLTKHFHFRWFLF